MNEFNKKMCLRCGKIWTPRKRSDVCGDCGSRNIDDADLHEGEVINYIKKKQSKRRIKREIWTPEFVERWNDALSSFTLNDEIRNKLVKS